MPIEIEKRASLKRVAVAMTIAAAVAGCKGDQRTGSGRIRAVLTGEDAPVVTLVTGDTLHLQPSVVKFYEDRGYEPAWTDNDEILDRGRAMLEALRQATEDGLDPERYQYSVADRLAGVLAKDSVDDVNDGLEELAYLGDLDIILTEGFYRYGKDLVEGTLDPKSAGLVWRIPRGEPPTEQLIVDVLNGADPAETLRALRPATPYYARMMKALAHYSDVEAGGGWPTVAGANIRAGETSASAGSLRRRLIAEGDPVEADLAQKGMADSTRFDGDLAAALSHFQRRHGLVPDSALGPATLAELNAPASQRVLELKINLDRWRWLPRSLGDRFIMVNIAGFEMELVEHDQPALSMNVVVGKEAWETPVFADTMKYLIVNPYWNVPASIQKDEVIPALMRDPGYLDRNGFEVVDSRARVVDAGSVDWSEDASSYAIRQRPGRSNALGKLKFMLPNDLNIYLHDTPADHLFSRNSRAFSHGCIRLEHPRELARHLMQTVTGTSPDNLEDLIASGKEKRINFTEGVPVYIVYFTGWAAPDGSVRFYPDIYGQDRRLDPDARRKLETPAGLPSTSRAAG